MPIRSIDNEKELLQEIAKGDQKAFAELFNAYNNQLGEYILMLTASEEMTEEIIVDVFVKVWMNRLELASIENFSSYVFIITRNYTLNCIRKTVSERKKQDTYIMHLADEEKHLVSNLADDDKDYTEIIEKAVAQLPSQQQKVFILKREGKKNGDIAAELRISPESVRKYYQWAVKSISGYVKAHIEVTLILAFVGAFCK